MDRGDQPNFTSKDHEIVYWKNLVNQLVSEKENVQKEFDDYMSESQQLEKEYESTIEQNERKISELLSNNNRYQNEIDSLRSRIEECIKEKEDLEKEVCLLRKEKVDHQKKIRELEQRNDDLERAQRMKLQSIAEVEAALNTMMERNVLLESEIDEKELLKEKLQRLTDETRDLKQELSVRERVPDNERALNGHMDSNRLKVEGETQTTPLKQRDPNVTLESQLSPSRILALNIVGDLLRKVGNLEAQLGYNRSRFNRETGDTRRSQNTAKPRTSSSVQGLK